MTKICFVFGGNLKMCPYINTYINLIGENNQYDIIFWERYKTKNSINYTITPNQIYCFKRKVSNSIDKIMGFYSFRKYTENILKNNKYDKIIFLQTNMALMCSKYIQKNPNVDYFLDIRDYSNEFKKYIFNKEKKIYPFMKYIAISSEGYKSFLPKGYKYILIHNLQNYKMMVSESDIIKKNNEIIKIGYIGNMNLYSDNLCKVLSKFKNDNRFVWYFIGIGSDKILDYCNNNDIKNVVIKGEFKPEEINQLYQSIDIVNNLYGNDNPYLDYALSNKLYLAAQYCLPILVCPKTSMEHISVHYKFGFALDINKKNIADELYDWYKKIDQKELYVNCKMFNEKVVDDNLRCNSIISDFLGRRLND